MTGVEAQGGAGPSLQAAGLIAAADLDRAWDAVSGELVRTPVLRGPALSERCGSEVVLKAECLQLTGSFKLRGVLARVAAMGVRAERGLVTASAGNHARAVAQAARMRGVPCQVLMPRDAPVSKVLAVQALGAAVTLEGASVDDALVHALRLAEESGAEFIHPFDDLDVIAGQATLGMELLEDVPDLARVVVPVGGGGLASGIGIAARRLGRNVSIVGVQAAACAPYAKLLGEASSTEGPVGSATIADGIAVKRPGELTLPLLRELLDELVTVDDDQIADAMVHLAGEAKLLSEGAGAVAVAALMSGKPGPCEGTTVAVVSGGNVDSGLLASVLLRHESEEGRRVRIFTRVPDRPGGLAELLGLIATTRANVVSVEHLREAVPLRVRETAVELVLETRGPGHTDQVLSVLAAGGYEARVG